MDALERRFREAGWEFDLIEDETQTEPQYTERWIGIRRDRRGATSHHETLSATKIGAMGRARGIEESRSGARSWKISWTRPRIIGNHLRAPTCSVVKLKIGGRIVTTMWISQSAGAGIWQPCSALRTFLDLKGNEGQRTLKDTKEALEQAARVLSLSRAPGWVPTEQRTSRTPGPKRPRDANQLAFEVVRESVREDPPDTGQDPVRSA